MPDASPRLALPLIAPAQAQKHVTHNEALMRLDTIAQLCVEQFGAVAPPPVPAQGAVYALGDGAQGAWAGQDGMLATWLDAGWRFIQPGAGWRAWGKAAGELRIHDGTSWVPMPGGGTGPALLENLEGVGIAATPDAVNRLAVAAEATLLSHAGAGHQLKINKAGPAETASLLFQSGWAGRAEMGLAGTDGFAVKVSADGALWHTALEVDPATGQVSFPATGLPLAAGQRPVLSAPRTWYVELGGDDTADGLAPATAFATLARALAAAEAVDAAGHDLTVVLGPGTHALGATLSVGPRFVGGGGLAIAGSGAGATFVTAPGDVLAVEGARLALAGLTLSSTGPAGAALRIGPGARFSGTDLGFGAAGRAHILMDAGEARLDGTLALTGGADHHAELRGSASLVYDATAVSLVGAPGFPGGFLDVTDRALVRAAGVSFSGSATGPRFAIRLGGIVDTAGAGLEALPGDAPGTVIQAGLYA